MFSDLKPKNHHPKKYIIFLWSEFNFFQNFFSNAKIPQKLFFQKIYFVNKIRSVFSHPSKVPTRPKYHPTGSITRSPGTHSPNQGLKQFVKRPTQWHRWTLKKRKKFVLKFSFFFTFHILTSSQLKWLQFLVKLLHCVVLNLFFLVQEFNILQKVLNTLHNLPKFWPQNSKFWPNLKIFYDVLTYIELEYHL